MSTSVSGVSKHFPSAENGFTTTLSGSISSGAATVGLNSVAGYTNGEVAVFVVDPTDAAKKQTFTGTIDTGGVQVTDVVWTAGTNQAHSAGATVVDYATATHISMMTKGLLVEHAQTGLHTLTSSATITSSKVITGLNDTNGNEIFKVGATGSAVNELTLTNAATGNAPIISSTGGDTNIGLTLTPKGTGNVSMTSRADGWVTGLTAPSTVTANGNRNYDVVINSTDYTDRLSPGMRLRLTRTVTAPTQCTDLESGSSQYFSKSSPNKMTFTDDFTCMAWIKTESLGTQQRIIGRISGTNGWHFGITAAGVLYIEIQPGAGTTRSVVTYQTLNTGEWIHVAASMDASAGSTLIYINGILVDSVSSGSASSLTQAGDLQVGSAGTTNYFDGKLAQVAVFDAVISASTIRSYMSQGLSGTETNLKSAYSFNNSIADLNTTTPNDLTANAAAVATATDTPFSGGSGGTTEYAEIGSISFSTNTTIKVQVPSGYAIPTSGGISALAYSTDVQPFSFSPLSRVVQMAYTQTGVLSTTTTAIPFDDTIPQNTEGAHLLSQTITPTSASSLLRIEAVIYAGCNPADRGIIALFQDSTANALAATSTYIAAAGGEATITLLHTMIAGTTSPTTFKIRGGESAGATFTFNGTGGARKFGGVIPSSLTITEIKA